MITIKDEYYMTMPEKYAGSWICVDGNPVYAFDTREEAQWALLYMEGGLGWE
jgi:hypothetical protein